MGERHMTGFRRFMRAVGIGLAAVAVGGVAVGAGARLAMRVVAVTDETPATTFTPGGTLGFPPLNLAMFGGLCLLYGVGVAGVVAWLDRRLPGTHRGGLCGPERAIGQPVVAAAQASDSRSGPNADLGM